MENTDYWRQLDIISPRELENVKITIVGTGGIGSPTAFVLSKMGIKSITAIDFDSVECHNVPNTIYRPSDTGKPKVEALQSIIEDFTDTKIEPVISSSEDQQLSGIVISGVDSMQSRQKIWDAVKYNTKIPLYIDGRMGGEVARIYTIRPTVPDQIRFYESTLYTDEKASDEACTNKAIIYNVFMIASLIAAQVKRFVKAQEYPKEEIFDFVTRYYDSKI